MRMEVFQRAFRKLWCVLFPTDEAVTLPGTSNLSKNEYLSKFYRYVKSSRSFRFCLMMKISFTIIEEKIQYWEKLVFLGSGRQPIRKPCVSGITLISLGITFYEYQTSWERNSLLRVGIIIMCKWNMDKKYFSSANLIIQTIQMQLSYVLMQER